MEAINRFQSEVKRGTLLGNILFNRYVKNTEWMKNNLSMESQKRLADVVAFIKTYADQYDFEWSMIAAQGYQESPLIQSKRSPAGAIGTPHVMLATALDQASHIPRDPFT